MVYVVVSASPVASQAAVEFVFGDSRAASDACGRLINSGKRSATIVAVAVPTPGVLSDSTVWLLSNGNDFQAFCSMEAADAMRTRLGATGTVRSYRVIGWSGKVTMAARSTMQKGSMQDFPADEAGFFRAFKKAIRNPQDAFRRGLE